MCSHRRLFTAEPVKKYKIVPYDEAQGYVRKRRGFSASRRSKPGNKRNIPQERTVKRRPLYFNVSEMQENFYTQTLGKPGRGGEEGTFRIKAQHSTTWL
jgi:hypothetical protein